MNRILVAQELVKIAREVVGARRWPMPPETVSEKRMAIRDVAIDRPLDLSEWMSDVEIERIIARIPDNSFQGLLKKALRV